jgi:nucleotide-binding universal stress UspA family protein
MKLLVPTAGPLPAEEKADYVMNIAKMLEAEVIAINISDNKDSPEGQEALDIYKKEAEKFGVKITTRLKSGDVISVISKAAESENVDLIVMGASEGRLVAKWVAVDIMEKSKVPIVIIPQGFTHMVD